MMAEGVGGFQFIQRCGNLGLAHIPERFGRAWSIVINSIGQDPAQFPQVQRSLGGEQDRFNDLFEFDCHG